MDLCVFYGTTKIPVRIQSFSPVEFSSGATDDLSHSTANPFDQHTAQVS